MACHHQQNKNTANQEGGRRGALASDQSYGEPTNWLSPSCKQEYNVLCVLIYSIVHLIKQRPPVKINLQRATVATATKGEESFSCELVRSGFTKCNLDLLCDTFTADLLTAYKEGKQLGIGVSCLCENRCSINHAGPANKASPSSASSSQEGGWLQARWEDRHPDSEGHGAARLASHRTAATEMTWCILGAESNVSYS